MTMIDEAPGQTPDAKPRRPRIVWVFTALAVIFFLIGVAGGSFESKLSEVQKNDNSSFLPGSADSTKVANESQKFNEIQSIPAFVLYQRSGGLTAADTAKAAKDLAKFAAVSGVAADEIRPGQVSKGGDVLAVSVPLIGKDHGKSAKGDDLVKSEKDIIKIAKAGAPPGLKVYTAGAGGLLVAFIDAFQGLDTSLLLYAGIVVIVILLFVYRSPVLWFFPLFSAGLALSASALAIYPLAKHGVITLNGQSQGILSVLVIGAGTDYALLLI
ncbi:MAG: MMPL family transporter, partial [Actinomycetota bacterium]|nr:MMPL family transporter [Actinomycetota bacterium]